MSTTSLTGFRTEVIARLSAALPGKNLHDLAREYAITIAKNGRVNKGWVGQTIERAAGLGVDNSPHRDGPDYELKSTSFVRRDGQWHPKEALRITQLSPRTILEETFETSAFWSKLGRLILVGVFHESPSRCLVTHVTRLDLADPDLIVEVKTFWEDVRHLVFTGDIADFSNLASTSGYIHLRPTGDGRQWSMLPTIGEPFRARAFYATRRLLKRMIVPENLGAK